MDRFSLFLLKVPLTASIIQVIWYHTYATYIFSDILTVFLISIFWDLLFHSQNFFYFVNCALYTVHSTLYTLQVWGLAKHLLQVFYIQFEASIKSISSDNHKMISHWNLDICAPLKSLRPTEGTLILITSVQSNLVFTVDSLLVSLIRATQLTGTFSFNFVSSTGIPHLGID